jgi:hypothetical protein
MSLISDALFLEATAADGALRPVDTAGADFNDLEELIEQAELEAPDATPTEQAAAVAAWIHAGNEGHTADGREQFPGLAWLRQPATHSDREWILEIARQYRQLNTGMAVIAEPPL